MKKIILLLLFGCLYLGVTHPVMAQNEDRVKSLLQEGLKLYGDHQYVRALDLFKQAQTLDPSNATASEYIKNTKQRILEWELQGSEKTDKKAVNWDNLAPSGSVTDTASNAKDIIAARKSLVERMKNRSTNTDDIVQIEEGAGSLNITLFQDQLFIPGLTTLRDEALPVLQQVADVIRNGEDRSVTLRAALHASSDESVVIYPDFSLPARDSSSGTPKSSTGASAMFQDLELTRSLILFSYLGQRGVGQASSSVLE